MKTFGKHFLIDVWVKEKLPNNLKNIMTKCAVATGATIMAEGHHEFIPQGETGFLILAESHLSWHSFPEEKYLSIDCYTCGSICDPEKIVAILSQFFTFETSVCQLLKRGIK